MKMTIVALAFLTFAALTGPAPTAALTVALVVYAAAVAKR